MQKIVIREDAALSLVRANVDGGCYALIKLLEKTQTYNLIATVPYRDVVIDEGPQGFTASLEIPHDGSPTAGAFKQNDPYFLIMTLDCVAHDDLENVTRLLDEHMSLCRTN